MTERRRGREKAGIISLNCRFDSIKKIVYFVEEKIIECFAVYFTFIDTKNQAGYINNQLKRELKYNTNMKKRKEKWKKRGKKI